MDKIWIFTSLHDPPYMTSEVSMHVCIAPLKPRLSSWPLFYCFYSLWETSKQLTL